MSIARPTELMHRTSLGPTPPRRSARAVVVVADERLALIKGFAALTRRGAGPQAWTTSMEHDPLAFLLDAIGDPVFLRTADGAVLSWNHAAETVAPLNRPPVVREEVELDGQRWERRCAEVVGGGVYLEVLHALPR